MGLTIAIIFYIITSIGGFIWIGDTHHNPNDALDTIIIILTLPVTVVLLILAGIICVVESKFMK